MNFDEMITEAIEKREVLELLRGEREYEVEVSRFTPDIFPTDINRILVNCFYKQVERIEKIDNIFIENLCKLLVSDAADVYTAILYFDACIFQEERGKATFKIEKESLACKIRSATNTHKQILQEEITFKNGMRKQNPWRNIQNFDNYYQKKYSTSII